MSIQEIKKEYNNRMCGLYDICNNCNKKVKLNINSVGKDTEMYSACTIFVCNKLTKYKKSSTI